MSTRGGIAVLAALVIGALPGRAAGGDAKAAAPQAKTAAPASSSRHEERGRPYDPKDYSAEEKERIDALFYRVICDCPEENWSRTLAQCAANCADPQKEQVRDAVKRGLTDREVLAEQLRLHGGDERVLAVPRSPLSGVLIALGAVALTAAVIAVLLRSVRRRPAAGRDRPGGPGIPSASAAETEEDRRIADEVERDLEEMDR